LLSPHNNGEKAGSMLRLWLLSGPQASIIYHCSRASLHGNQFILKIGRRRRETKQNLLALLSIFISKDCLPNKRIILRRKKESEIKHAIPLRGRFVRLFWGIRLEYKNVGLSILVKCLHALHFKQSRMLNQFPICKLLRIYVIIL
jgi:hypothetical protein